MPEATINDSSSAADVLSQFQMSLPSEAMSEVRSEPLQDPTTGTLTVPGEVHRDPDAFSGLPKSPGFRESQPVPVPEDFKPKALDLDNLGNNPNDTAPLAQPAEHVSRSRDLSLFPPEHHKAMRQMSNEAFAVVSKLAADAKAASDYKAQLETLNAQKDAWKYAHEESFKLAPEYEQFTKASERLNTEEAYWRQQLINYRNGQPAFMLVQDAQGNLRRGDQFEPKSPEAELILQEKLEQARGIKMELASEFANWRKDFTSSVTNTRTKITELQKAVFPNGYTDAVKPIAEQVLNWLPAAYRNQPEYQMLAGMYAYVQLANQTIAALKQQHTATNSINAARGQVPPSGATVTSGSSGRITAETPAAEALKLFAELIPS